MARKIDGKAVADDIQRSMSARMLRKKYDLSEEQLTNLAKQLKTAGLLAGRVNCPLCGYPYPETCGKCPECGSVNCQWTTYTLPADDHPLPETPPVQQSQVPAEKGQKKPRMDDDAYWVLVGLLCLFCFPIGLIVLWTSGRGTMQTKQIITSAVGLMWVLIIAIPKDQGRQTSPVARPVVASEFERTVQQTMQSTKSAARSLTPATLNWDTMTCYDVGYNSTVVSQQGITLPAEDYFKALARCRDNSREVDRGVEAAFRDIRRASR